VPCRQQTSRQRSIGCAIHHLALHRHGEANFTSIEAIETPAADTVVFKLNRQNPAALSMFASPWNCVYSAKKLAEDPAWYNTNVMGTGSFIFEEYAKGSHWSAKRFDQYFVSGKPYLDGIRAHFISSLAGDQVDAILFMVVPPDQARLRKMKGDALQLDTNVFNVTLFLTVNVRKPPFNDPRVRRALNLAIDRQGGLEGLKRIAAVDFLTVLVPPGGIGDYAKDEVTKLAGFGADIEASRAEAKRLLAEAGVPNLKLTLLNRNVRQPWQPVGVWVMDQWQQIGIEVDQIPAETPQYFAAITSGNYDVALDFNNTVSVDPNETLVKFVPGNPNNYSGADDRVLVELYDKQANSENPEQRKLLVRQFLDRMIDQLYSIPLIGSNRTTATLKHVKGWKTAPTTVMNLDMADVWLDK
jgi:peptide/nickel transport system substrate-binding protein